MGSKVSITVKEERDRRNKERETREISIKIQGRRNERKIEEITR